MRCTMLHCISASSRCDRPSTAFVMGLLMLLAFSRGGLSAQDITLDPAGRSIIDTEWRHDGSALYFLSADTLTRYSLENEMCSVSAQVPVGDIYDMALASAEEELWCITRTGQLEIRDETSLLKTDTAVLNLPTGMFGVRIAVGGEFAAIATQGRLSRYSIKARTTEHYDVGRPSHVADAIAVDANENVQAFYWRLDHATLSSGAVTHKRLADTGFFTLRMAFSEDGSTLLVGGRSDHVNKAYVYNTADEDDFCEVRFPGLRLWECAVSADGQYVALAGGALGGEEVTVECWHRPTMECVSRTVVPGSRIYDFQIHPASSRILGMSEHRDRVFLWNNVVFEVDE